MDEDFEILYVGRGRAEFLSNLYMQANPSGTKLSLVTSYTPVIEPNRNWTKIN